MSQKVLRPRLKVATLVASSHTARNIIAKRIEIKVKYREHLLGHRVVSYESGEIYEGPTYRGKKQLKS